MKFNHIYIILLGFIFLSFISFESVQQNDEHIKLLTNKTEFEAGSNIMLKFSSSQIMDAPLFCSNSYGSTVIYPISVDNNILSYELPRFMVSKTGMLNWKLVCANAISGCINITPQTNIAKMETYVGPPSIEAGGVDSTMQVLIPTDSLDNPAPENTLVITKYQFLDNEISEHIFTKNLIAYKSIFSEAKTGRMLLASEAMLTNSKEFTVDVLPAIPTNFTISSKQPHMYADGNQITEFSTSVLFDKYENIVSDGTFVTFYITNNQGNILKTSGITISGVAVAKIIHPDHEEQWRIKAYVIGIAESNELILDFKQVIEDFDVGFSENNRNVVIGPLKSFMKQTIPDGLQVTLSVIKNNQLIKTFVKTSNSGYVNFNLKPDIFIDATYDIIIKTAGLEKIFHNKKLW